MMGTSITKCVRIQPTSSMQQCIDTYGINGEGEWVNNSVSSLAQFWSCGMVSRKTEALAHDHDPKEVARCHNLAKKAAAVIGPVWPLFRSGDDPQTQPFFVVAQRRATVPKRVTEKVIRTALGGTLHPDAQVGIEPFSEATDWWQEVMEDAQEMAGTARDESVDDLVSEWRALMQWFPANSLAVPSFVRTTDSEEVSRTLGCVFPCFILGISDNGSLIGIATHIVE